jgi:hypothetical protein
VKTGSVQVKYADGTEHTLPFHGITQLQLLRLADELGFKNFQDLIGPEPNLAKVRLMTRTAAEALTFKKTQDIWTLERIEQSFADLDQVVKVFLACINLPSLPKAPTGEAQTRKQNLYH